jgi:hypothetical protein
MADLAQVIQNLRASDDPPEHTLRLLDSDDPANVSADVFAHALQDSVVSVVLVPDEPRSPWRAADALALIRFLRRVHNTEPTMRAAMVLRQLAPTGTQDHPRTEVLQGLAIMASSLAANEAEVLLDAAGLALTAMRALSSHNRADVAADAWWLAAKAALADLCPKLNPAHTGTPADLATMVVQLPRVAKARAFSHALEIQAFIDGVDVVQLLLSVAQYATMGIRDRDDYPPAQPAAAARVLAEGSSSLDALAKKFATKHFKAKGGVHTLDSDAGVMDVVQDLVGHLSTALF